MADYGIKITKAGSDVSTADDEDLIFSSKYEIMKTLVVGTYSYTFTSDITSVEIEIDHNQGERKVYWLSIGGPNSDQNTIEFWDEYVVNGGDSANRQWYGVGLDNSIKITYHEGVIGGSGYDPTGETWNFKYYIFVERLF
jgi:hypothetical protein